MLAGKQIFPMPVLVLCDGAFSQAHRWGVGIVITEDRVGTRTPIRGELGERSFGGTFEKNRLFFSAMPEQGCPECVALALAFQSASVCPRTIAAIVTDRMATLVTFERFVKGISVS